MKRRCNFITKVTPNQILISDKCKNKSTNRKREVSFFKQITNKCAIIIFYKQVDLPDSHENHNFIIIMNR